MSKRPTEAIIKREAERLLKLPNAPTDSTELARALKRHGRTDYHVGAIVQFLLDSAQFCPTPAAIHDAADICLDEPPPKYRATDPNCPLCLGRGFLIRHVGEYSGACVCDCRKVSHG